jgi:hypothetical protein
MYSGQQWTGDLVRVKWWELSNLCTDIQIKRDSAVHRRWNAWKEAIFSCNPGKYISLSLGISALAMYRENGKKHSKTRENRENEKRNSKKKQTKRENEEKTRIKDIRRQGESKLEIENTKRTILGHSGSFVSK